MSSLFICAEPGKHPTCSPRSGELAHSSQVGHEGQDGRPISQVPCGACALPCPLHSNATSAGARNEEVAMRDNYRGHASDRWRPNSAYLAFQIPLRSLGGDCSFSKLVAPCGGGKKSSHATCKIGFAMACQRVQCLPAVKVILLTGCRWFSVLANFSVPSPTCKLQKVSH